MFEYKYQSSELEYEANKEIYESNEIQKSSIISDIEKLQYKDKQKFQTLLDLSTNLLHQASMSRKLLNDNSEFNANFDKKVSKNKLVIGLSTIGLVAFTSIFGIGIEIILAFIVLNAYFINLKIEEYSTANKCNLRECIYRSQLDLQTIELIKLGLDDFDISKYSSGKKNVESQTSGTVFMEMALLKFEKDSLKRDRKILAKNFCWD